MAIIIICFVVGAGVNLFLETDRRTSKEADKLKELNLEKNALERSEKERGASQREKIPPSQVYVTPENLENLVRVLKERLAPEDLDKIKTVYKELTENKP